MGDIKAIETVYNGYRFRSRLEARWAVFFDAMGIWYEYEAEGYEYWETDEGTLKWLPDFMLPKEDNLLIEVKGSDEALKKDEYRIGMAVDYHNTPASDGLLILGSIPGPLDVGWGKIPVFSYLEWAKGVRSDYAAFNDSGHVIRGIEKIFKNLYSYNWEKFIADDFSSDGELPDSVSTKYLVMSAEDTFSDKNEKLKKAFTIARQARFEHGETPTPESIREMMEHA